MVSPCRIWAYVWANEANARRDARRWGVEDLYAVRVSGQAGGTVVCQGEMDICAEAPLRGALARVMQQAGDRVQVDLSEVRYIDSACIAALLRASDLLSRRGGRLVVVGMSPVVQRALLLLRLDGDLRPIR